MPNNFLPGTPAKVSLWLGNASTVINANLVTFGLTAADVTALNTAKTNLDSAMTNVQATVDAYHAAIKTRNAMLKAAGTTARATSKKVQANPALPVGLKAAAGFNVRKVPAKQLQPVSPSALVVMGDANGVNTLKWAGIGNKAGTTYQIEAMVYGASEFSLIGTATKRKFLHTGQMPGLQITYRVSAVRSTLISAPSNEAVVYRNGFQPRLTMAKAA